MASYTARRAENGETVEPYAAFQFGDGEHAARAVYRWYDGDQDEFATEEGVIARRITRIFWARSQRHATEIWREHSLLPS